MKLASARPIDGYLEVRFAVTHDDRGDIVAEAFRIGDFTAVMAAALEDRELPAVVDYLAARAQLRQHDDRSAERVTAAKAKIASLREKRLAMESSLETPNLGGRLAAADGEIASAEADLAKIAAERETLVPIVQRLRGPAVAAIEAVAHEAFAAHRATVEKRRVDLVAAIEAAVGDQLADLFAIESGIITLFRYDASRLASSAAVRVLDV